MDIVSQGLVAFGKGYKLPGSLGRNVFSEFILPLLGICRPLVPFLQFESVVFFSE